MMFKTKINEIPVYKFELFDRISTIEHFVTTREFAPITDSIRGFNLSYKVNDLEENVTTNRNALAQNLGVASESLFIPVQTHSSNIKIVNSEKDRILDDTDALITARKGLCIAIMTADCVPVLIYDYKNGVAAAIHAGWKGTIDDIVTKTIKKMVHKFGAETKNMVAAIGPSICEKVYEVGNEVAQYFEVLDESAKKQVVLQHANPDKKYLNLPMANKLQLLEMGVKPENIEMANICTFSNHEQFYSARYFKNNCGRFATGIMIK